MTTVSEEEEEEDAEEGSRRTAENMNLGQPWCTLAEQQKKRLYSYGPPLPVASWLEAWWYTFAVTSGHRAAGRALNAIRSNRSIYDTLPVTSKAVRIENIVSTIEQVSVPRPGVLLRVSIAKTSH